jgi:hypothetical protein
MRLRIAFPFSLRPGGADLTLAYTDGAGHCADRGGEIVRLLANAANEQ